MCFTRHFIGPFLHAHAFWHDGIMASVRDPHDVGIFAHFIESLQLNEAIFAIRAHAVFASFIHLRGHHLHENVVAIFLKRNECKCA
jgi:hypothetical protein